MKVSPFRYSGIYILALFLLISPESFGQDTEKKLSIFRDSTDGAIDMSDWLVEKKGVLLIPSIITEPAVGYGGLLAAVYFHSSYSEKHGPPSMTGAMGAYTENGTWAAGAFHMGFWKQDHLRYIGGLARTNANLEYYGPGLIFDDPVNLNLDAWFLFQQLKGRIGDSKFFIGGKYILLDTENTFNIPIDIPEYEGTQFHSTLSEASLLVNYDSRNNVFTPTKGFNIQMSGTYSDTWFGSDSLYGRLDFEGIAYAPVSSKVMIGMRYRNHYSLGGVPFYARPSVQLRGAPFMKYQGDHVMEFEAEATFEVTKRWSIVGFAGMGNAYSSIEDFEDGKSVRTLGTGFRYLLMRKLGTKMGIDIAASQDDFAFYIIFGSAWFR